jgi:hypothetical protein
MALLTSLNTLRELAAINASSRTMAIPFVVFGSLISFIKLYVLFRFRDQITDSSRANEFFELTNYLNEDSVESFRVLLYDILNK